MKTSSRGKINYDNWHSSAPSLRKKIGSWKRKLEVCRSELCGIRKSNGQLGNWFPKFPDGTQQTWQAVEEERLHEVNGCLS